MICQIQQRAPGDVLFLSRSSTVRFKIMLILVVSVSDFSVESVSKLLSTFNFLCGVCILINLNCSSRNLLVGNVHFSREKTSGLPYLAGGQNLTNALINTNRSAISNMSYQGQLIFAHGKLILCHRHVTYF